MHTTGEVYVHIQYTHNIGALTARNEYSYTELDQDATYLAMASTEYITATAIHWLTAAGT